MRNSFGFMFYLAGLSMLGYLATDMYLPAFGAMREELQISAGAVSASLSIFLAARPAYPGTDRRVETHHAGGTRQKRPHRRTAVACRPHLPRQPAAGRASAGRAFGNQRRHPHHRA